MAEAVTSFVTSSDRSSAAIAECVTSIVTSMDIFLRARAHLPPPSGPACAHARARARARAAATHSIATPMFSGSGASSCMGRRAAFSSARAVGFTTSSPCAPRARTHTHAHTHTHTRIRTPTPLIPPAPLPGAQPHTVSGSRMKMLKPPAAGAPSTAADSRRTPSSATSVMSPTARRGACCRPPDRPPARASARASAPWSPTAPSAASRLRWSPPPTCRRSNSAFGSTESERCYDTHACQCAPEHARGGRGPPPPTAAARVSVRARARAGRAWPPPTAAARTLMRVFAAPSPAAAARSRLPDCGTVPGAPGMLTHSPPSPPSPPPPSDESLPLRIRAPAPPSPPPPSAPADPAGAAAGSSPADAPAAGTGAPCAADWTGGAAPTTGDAAGSTGNCAQGRPTRLYTSRGHVQAGADELVRRNHVCWGGGRS